MKACRILLLLLLPVVAVAQEDLLTMQEAVEVALRENEDIELARTSSAIAGASSNWGNAGFLPNLNASGSYNYAVNDITQQLAVTQDSAGPPAVPNTIENAVSETWNASAMLSYVLFDGFGRINNLRKLQLQRELSETQLRFTIENTLLQIFNAYFGVARQMEQTQVDLEAIDLSLDRYKRAEAALELGSQSRLEKLNALVDLRTDSVNYLNSLTQLQKNLRQLNLLLDFPIDSNYRVDTSITLDQAIDYAELKEQASESNAALVQAQFQRQIGEKEIDIAWSNYYPELQASGGYQYNRQENEGSFLQFSEQEGWQAGVSVNWNLFNSYRTATQIQIAKLNLEQDKLQVEQSRDQLSSDLSNAYIDYRNNLQILRMTRRNLAVAALNFERSQEAYRLGQINSTQLREAQLNYIRTKLRLTNLKYSVKISEIELKRVAGVLIQSI